MNRNTYSERYSTRQPNSEKCPFRSWPLSSIKIILMKWIYGVVRKDWYQITQKASSFHITLHNNTWKPYIHVFTSRWRRSTINIVLNVRPRFSRVSFLPDIKYAKIHYKKTALKFLLKLLKSLKGILNLWDPQYAAPQRFIKGVK